jgi:hypothetical protein
MTRLKHIRQPPGDGTDDVRAMTFQRMRLPRHDDHPIRVPGTRDPERVTLTVHHQYGGTGRLRRMQFRHPGRPRRL